MSAFNSRHALAAISLLALLPSLAVPAEAGSTQAEGFRPPAGAMVFTRRLVRELPGGEAIIVTRTFEIRFFVGGGGYRVEGTQTSAHVSAPQSLSGLARLEEQRQETGLFPMVLDASGRIMAGPNGDTPDLTQAVDEGFAYLARHPLTRPDQKAAQEFLIGLQTVAASITTAMPIDLFTGNPSPLERTQDLTMPDGKPGRVSVSYAGTARQGGGLLAHAQRVVTTQSSGSALRSIEEWTLEPAVELPHR